MGVLNVKVNGQWVPIPSGGSAGVPVPGPEGPPGPAGPTGPAGPATTQFHIHEQPTPADVWTIDHALSFYPGVTIVDPTGVQTEGTVQYVSPTQIVVTFSGGPRAGRAFLS